MSSLQVFNCVKLLWFTKQALFLSIATAVVTKLNKTNLFLNERKFITQRF